MFIFYWEFELVSREVKMEDIFVKQLVNLEHKMCCRRAQLATKRKVKLNALSTSSAQNTAGPWCCKDGRFCEEQVIVSL